MVSAGHVGGTHGSGILSSAADVLWMSLVRGMRGVGGVYEMYVCLDRGSVGGERGEWMRGLGLVSGMAQGTVLDPLLFLLHINVLPSVVSSKVRLFADDCLIYRNIKNKEDQIALQKAVNLCENWGNTWGMRFDAAKCNIMRVSRTRDPKLFYYSLTGQVLEEVMDAKYLVVTLSNDLEWSKHIATITNKANFKFLHRNLKGCPEKLKQTVYFSLIHSFMEYGATVWDPYHKSNSDKFESMQHRAARFVKSRYSRYSNVSDVLGWTLLSQRRQEARLILFYKIINGLAQLPFECVLVEAYKGSKRKHNMKFRQIGHTTSQYGQSFFPKTISAWNRLAFAEAPPLAVFRSIFLNN